MDTKKIVELSKLLVNYFDPKPIIDGFSSYQVAEMILQRLFKNTCTKHPLAELVDQFGCEECFLESLKDEASEDDKFKFETAYPRAGE